jgi:secreted trypsin-like serine protease
MAGYGVTKVTAVPVEARKVKDLKKKIDEGDVVCDDSRENCMEIEMTGDGELQQTAANIAYVIRSEIRVDESKGHGTCSGDSGGPIYLEQNGQYYLIGVTSRGSGMCDKVGIYTNALYYKDWITFNLKRF